MQYQNTSFNAYMYMYACIVTYHRNDGPFACCVGNLTYLSVHCSDTCRIDDNPAKSILVHFVVLNHTCRNQTDAVESAYV